VKVALAGLKFAHMMLLVRTIGIFSLALAAGCAGVREAPTSVMAQAGPVMVDPSRVGPHQDGVVAAEPPRSEAKEEATVALAPSPAGPREPVMTGDTAAGIEPVAGAPTPPSKGTSAARAAPPPAKAPAKVSAAPVAVEQPRKNEDPPPVARTAEPPLDVAALKSRLRETNAIGLFTKLALKNQVDDLLEQFRAHHQSGQKSGVASLRQPYNSLVLKVLSLVQDSDPSLARTISGSREAIWAILADREKFNSVT